MIRLHFFFYAYADYRALHSFPTRRSSDLYELLLTDIVMPEMDGIELARRAAELDPDIKIMFITGFAAVALNPDANADRKSTRLNSSHSQISYAVFCLKKKKNKDRRNTQNT